MKSQSSSTTSLVLVTNKMCPFAQKAWIALEASDITYEMKQVSLYGPGGKPDWFWKLNPKGQVPVVVSDNENVIVDSDRILDEFASGSIADSSLRVKDEDQEYKIKKFRTKIDELLPIGKSAVLGGDKIRLWEKLKELDDLIDGAPCVAGDQITVADCAGFPFLWRLNEEFPEQWLQNGCHNIPIWLDFCSVQKPFKKTIQSPWWWWW